MQTISQNKNIGNLENNIKTLQGKLNFERNTQKKHERDCSYQVNRTVSYDRNLDTTAANLRNQTVVSQTRNSFKLRTPRKKSKGEVFKRMETEVKIRDKMCHIKKKKKSLQNDSFGSDSEQEVESTGRQVKLGGRILVGDAAASNFERKRLDGQTLPKHQFGTQKRTHLELNKID